MPPLGDRKGRAPRDEHRRRRVPALHAPADLAGQGCVLVAETTRWFSDNSLRILIAFGVAALIVVLLLGVKDIVRRLCRESEGLIGWRTIIARVAAKTSFWFLVLVAARLVDGYAEAPPLLDKTIGLLFTIGCTFQAAIWARELVLGFVEHRAGIRTTTIVCSAWRWGSSASS